MELNNSKIKIKAKNLNVYYGKKQALFDINLDINQKEVTALIGPSGCGKSTFIRCINRMNDVIDICKVCLLYTSPSPRDVEESRMPSSA